MGDGYDKAAYAQQKRQEKQQYNEQLSSAMASMATDSEKFRLYLEVQGRLPLYSVGNAIMVAMQFPEARRLRLSSEWASLGIQPRRGQKGIAILVPGSQFKKPDGSIGQGYDVRRAFDISQTTAAAQPDPTSKPTEQDLLRGLLDYQKGAWEIKTADNCEPARYDPEQTTIFIRKQQQFAPLFSALSREVICADIHLRKGVGRIEAEPVAECVAWMLCSRFEVQPAALTLPNPNIIMGMDDKAYRYRLAELVEPLRSLLNYMDKSIAKSRKSREVAI